MKIANIVTCNKVDVTDDINVVKELSDIIEGIPTLVTSYAWVSKNYDDYEIYDKKLSENLYWTFARTERRDIFTTDIESFVTMANKKLIEDINYIFIDLIQYPPLKIKKIIKKILSIDNRIGFKHNDMIYIYGDKLIFGIDLYLVRYMGLNVERIEKKIMDGCSVFLGGDEIFIEYKDNLERLNHSIKYIPYLYSIKNAK